VGDEDGLDEAVTGIGGAGTETSEGASLDGSVRGSFHRGHFFASGESSRTSTTSTTCSPAKRYLRSIFTFFGS